MSWLVRATLAATFSKLHRRVSPYTLLHPHQRPIGEIPREVRHFEYARLAVRDGAPSLHPVVETEKYFLKSIGVRKEKLTCITRRLYSVLRWAFLSKRYVHTGRHLLRWVRFGSVRF
jgi:hypothetical protein